MGQGRRDKLCDPRVALLCISLGAVCQSRNCRVCFINKFVAPIRTSHPFFVKDKKKNALRYAYMHRTAVILSYPLSSICTICIGSYARSPFALGYAEKHNFCCVAGPGTGVPVQDTDASRVTNGS